MNPATNPWLLCPFCGGTAQRIREEKRDSPSMLAELGLALTTETCRTVPAFQEKVKRHERAV